MTIENQLSQFSSALADAAQKAARSVVLVNGRERLPGSGVLIGAGQVLTADHVLERNDEITILLDDGTELPAAIAGRDPRSDLALLTLSQDGGTAAETGAQARVGELVLAIGRPGSNGIQASLGVVSAFVSFSRGGRRHSQPTPGETLLRTDAISYPGFSGGPLINSAGQVLGINTSGLVRGASIAIPIARALEIAAALQKHGSLRRGYLGIRSQIAPLTAEQQTRLGRAQTSGLLVAWIEENSPSAASALIVGDIIVAISGDPVADHADLQHVLIGDIVGQQAAVEILRGGEPTTVTVTIGERKD